MADNLAETEAEVFFSSQPSNSFFSVTLLVGIQKVNIAAALVGGGLTNGPDT